MKNTNTHNISITYRNDKNAKDALINIILDYMLNENFIRKEGSNGGKNHC